MENVNARSIFTPAGGYLRRGGFAWTCNPYVGCSFGCSYCYAMFLPQNRRPREEWGRWFQAKANALELARRDAPRLADQAVYLSSVTDPYIPVERRLRLTRGILEAMLPHRPSLLVQTRGPLVVRDLDLLGRFDAVRVNVSIPTDSEAVRRAFEPRAPTLARRWEALARIREAGVPVGVCVTPMLPLEDPDGFAHRLAAFQPEVVVAEDFHRRRGAFGADTGPIARRRLDEWRWGPENYERALAALRQAIPVREGVEGFVPPGKRPHAPGTSTHLRSRAD